MFSAFRLLLIRKSLPPASISFTSASPPTSLPIAVFSNLWIVNFDGSEHRPLTTGTYSDSSPRWSPDGTRVAFVSDRDGKSQLYVHWMDSGQTAKLTDVENAPAGISWSPDGKQIGFTSLVPSDPPKIATLPAAPEGAKWADAPKVYEDLIYRFNGPGYLKPGYSQLFVVAADGGAPRQLTTGNSPHGPGAGDFGRSYVSWAPDGKSLIFSMNGTANYEYEPLHTELFEIRVGDGSLTQLPSRDGAGQGNQIRWATCADHQVAGLSHREANGTPCPAIRNHRPATSSCVSESRQYGRAVRISLHSAPEASTGICS
jgi:dipeptidyl aminopeptidase/acylaminoacyl peptidase